MDIMEKGGETDNLLEVVEEKPEKSYRSFTCTIVFLLVLVFSFALVIGGVVFIVLLITFFNRIPSDPFKRAQFLAKYTPLIDGHNDFPEKIYELINKDLPIKFHMNTKITDEEVELLKNNYLTLDTDFSRMKSGSLGAQFWVVYKSCKITGNEAVQKAFETFSLIEQMIRTYSDETELALTADDIWRIFLNGKIVSLIGVEGGQMINSDLDVLRGFYAMGARYLTLTHNCNTAWADSCCDESKPHNGLTDFGKKVINQLNQLGMMVDLSHTSQKTMEDALEVTKAPVIFSHSNAFSICGHERNIRDSVIKQVKENRGIIMVTFCTQFVSEEERLAQIEIAKDYSGNNYTKKIWEWEENNPDDRASISKVADHIDYIKTLHDDSCYYIGIGSDFDGIDTHPKDLEDVSKHVFLIEELINRGYSNDCIKNILGNNLIRVFREVEDVSKIMSNSTIFTYDDN